MCSHNRTHRLTAWLALWAVVLSALMPAVAQAVVGGHRDGRKVELCTSTGMVLVQAADDSSDDALKSVVNCTWCLVHPFSAGLPSKYTGVWVQPQAHILVAESQAGVFAHALWQPAQPRAPPGV